MRHRADLNQNGIVVALRAAGCSVHVLSQQGDGCPDVLVGVHGQNLLLEIKAPTGKRTPLQLVWHAAWRGRVQVVTSVTEALALIDRARRA